MDLVEVQAERDHALSRIERYKKANERQKAIEMAANQELQCAHGDKKQDLRQTLKRVKELEGLANSLSGSVKEKSLALTHQKKANKMLAKRIAELEHRLKVLEISGLWSNSDSLLPEMEQQPLSPEIVTSEGFIGVNQIGQTCQDFKDGASLDDGTGERSEEDTERVLESEKSSVLDTDISTVKESPSHSAIVNLA